jgi:hypothetical protein
LRDSISLGKEREINQKSIESIEHSRLPQNLQKKVLLNIHIAFWSRWW